MRWLMIGTAVFAACAALPDLMFPTIATGAGPGAAAGIVDPRADDGYDAIRFGARGDGITNDAAAIQAAIDRCSQDGGGKVLLARGTFLSGTLRLRSHVHLEVAQGATLLGSPRSQDYPPNPTPRVMPATQTADAPAAHPEVPGGAPEHGARSLIYAGGADDVGLTGGGTIDGNGTTPGFQAPSDNAAGQNGAPRQLLLMFEGCTRVTVEGLTLRNSAAWMQHYRGCRDVRLRGLRVHNHCNWNNDGMDIESREVVISDCDIDAEDDALCLKSGGGWPCRDVTVTHCVLASNCNAFKMGTESAGGFQNITVSDCIVRRASEHNKGRKTVMSGIALEIVDGGTLDQVSVSNFAMSDVQTPLFIKLGNRAGHAGAGKPPGTLKNVVVGDIVATGVSSVCSSITGFPGHDIEDLTLHDLLLTTPGGGTPEDARRAVPENEKGYPENNMFGGILPASGLYLRHAKNVVIRNVVCRTSRPDARPALVCDDVRGLDVSGFAATSPPAGPLIRLVQSGDALLHACRLREPASLWLRVEGEQAGNITLTGNDLTLARQSLELAGGARAGAIRADDVAIER